MPLRVHVKQYGLERDIRRAVKNVNRRGGLNLSVNDKSFTRPLGKITGSVSEFNKSLEASNARVLAFGASVGIIQGVQRAFAGLVKSTVMVEKALAEVNVVMGGTAEQLAEFAEGMFRVAKNTAQSFSTVATAATELARQGLSMEETLKRTNDALILTRLTGMDAAASVKGLTAALNTFNQAGLDSTKILSKMAAVDVQFAVSTEDLVDGIARAGAVAQDAGVSFDQLLGAVTAAQQTTARGGKVIGNSFKTIFTRVQRGSTIQRLEELGIAVRDLAGNTLPAITVLSNLAKTYDSLTDTTKAAVAEQVGGVFQINILKATIKDLANQNSVLARATRTAAQASDEAYKKNELLNKTISALSSQTVTAVQELAAVIGKIGFDEPIRKWLSVVKQGAEFFTGLLTDGEDEGHSWAKGFVKGIGNVIGGPVMLAAIAVLGSLFKKTMGFLFKSTAEMMGITSAASKQKEIQASIVALLGENSALQKRLLGQEGNRAAQERIILGLLQAQAREQIRMAALAKAIGPGIARAGFGANLQRRASSGFIPNYASSTERKMEKAGAQSGGYAPGAIKTMKIPGEGKVVYNSAEQVRNFPGMAQPAIMPPKRSLAGREYGTSFKNVHGFNPYASGGFVPNYMFRRGPMDPNKAREILMQRQATARKQKGLPSSEKEAIGMGQLRGMLNSGQFSALTYNPIGSAAHVVKKGSNTLKKPTHSGVRSGVHSFKKGVRPPTNRRKSSVFIPKDNSPSPIEKNKHEGYEVKPGERYPSWASYDLATGSKVIWAASAGEGKDAYRRLYLERILNISHKGKNFNVDPNKASSGFVPNYIFPQQSRGSARTLLSIMQGQKKVSGLAGVMGPGGVPMSPAQAAQATMQRALEGWTPPPTKHMKDFPYHQFSSNEARLMMQMEKSFPWMGNMGALNKLQLWKNFSGGGSGSNRRLLEELKAGDFSSMLRMDRHFSGGQSGGFNSPSTLETLIQMNSKGHVPNFARWYPGKGLMGHRQGTEKYGGYDKKFNGEGFSSSEAFTLMKLREIEGIVPPKLRLLPQEHKDVAVKAMKAQIESMGGNPNRIHDGTPISNIGKEALLKHIGVIRSGGFVPNYGLNWNNLWGLLNTDRQNIRDKYDMTPDSRGPLGTKRYKAPLPLRVGRFIMRLLKGGRRLFGLGGKGKTPTPTSWDEIYPHSQARRQSEGGPHWSIMNRKISNITKEGPSVERDYSHGLIPNYSLWKHEPGIKKSSVESMVQSNVLAGKLGEYSVNDKGINSAFRSLELMDKAGLDRLKATFLKSIDPGLLEFRTSWGKDALGKESSFLGAKLTRDLLASVPSKEFFGYMSGSSKFSSLNLKPHLSTKQKAKLLVQTGGIPNLKFVDDNLDQLKQDFFTDKNVKRVLRSEMKAIKGSSSRMEDLRKQNLEAKPSHQRKLQLIEGVNKERRLKQATKILERGLDAEFAEEARKDAAAETRKALRKRLGLDRFGLSGRAGRRTSVNPEAFFPHGPRIGGPSLMDAAFPHRAPGTAARLPLHLDMSPEAMLRREEYYIDDLTRKYSRQRESRRGREISASEKRFHSRRKPPLVGPPQRRGPRRLPSMQEIQRQKASGKWRWDNPKTTWGYPYIYRAMGHVPNYGLWGPNVARQREFPFMGRSTFKGGAPEHLTSSGFRNRHYNTILPKWFMKLWAKRKRGGPKTSAPGDVPADLDPYAMPSQEDFRQMLKNAREDMSNPYYNRGGESRGFVPNYSLFGPGAKNILKANPAFVGATIDSIKRESSFGVTPKVVSAPELKGQGNPGLAVVNKEQEKGSLANARRLHGGLNPKQGASQGFVPNYQITPFHAAGIEAAARNIQSLSTSAQNVASAFQMIPTSSQTAIDAFNRLAAESTVTADAAKEANVRSRRRKGKGIVGDDRAFAREMFRNDQAQNLRQSRTLGPLVDSLMEGGRLSETKLTEQIDVARQTARTTGDTSVLSALMNLNKNMDDFATNQMNPKNLARMQGREMARNLTHQLRASTSDRRMTERIMGQGPSGGPVSFDRSAAQRHMAADFLASRGFDDQRLAGMTPTQMAAVATGSRENSREFRRYMRDQGVVSSNAALAGAGFRHGELGGRGRNDVRMRHTAGTRQYTSAMERHQRLLQAPRAGLLDFRGRRAQQRAEAASRNQLMRLSGSQGERGQDTQRLTQGVRDLERTTREQVGQQRAETRRNDRLTRAGRLQGRGGFLNNLRAGYLGSTAGGQMGSGAGGRIGSFLGRLGPGMGGAGGAMSRGLGFFKAGGMGSLGLSMALPMLAGMLQSQTPRTKRAAFDSSTGTYKVKSGGDTLGMHSERAPGVMMGAGIGAIFGLPGMIIGATMGWVSASKKMTLSLEELAQIQEEGNQKLSQNLQAGDKVQGLLVQRGQMASSGDLRGMTKTNSQINMLLGQITDPAMQSALSRNAGSLEGFQRVMGNYANKLARGTGVTNFISASKDGNVANAGAALGTIFDNAMSNATAIQTAKFEATFAKINAKMDDMNDRAAAVPKAFLEEMRAGAGGGFGGGNATSSEAIGWGTGLAVAALVVAGFFTKGLTWKGAAVVASAGAAGAGLGVAIGAGQEAEEKRQILTEFRQSNAGAYDFMEEFHNIGVLTDDEYKRLTAAFERGSLTAHELVTEVERSIKNLKKTREQGAVLASKTFDMERTFNEVNRNLSFDIDKMKIQAGSDKGRRDSAIQFSQRFQDHRGVYDASRFGTERRVTSHLLLEKDKEAIFSKGERKDLVAFTKNVLGKMNVPMDVQESLTREFAEKPLSPGMVAPYQLLEKHFEANRFTVNRKMVDVDTTPEDRKVILAQIGRVIAGMEPGVGTGQATTDLSKIMPEIEGLLGEGATSQEALEELVTKFLPSGTSALMSRTPGGGRRTIQGTSGYQLSDLGLRTTSTAGVYEMDLDVNDKLQQTEISRQLGRTVRPASAAVGAFNPDIEYDRTFSDAEAKAMEDSLDALKKKRDLFYEQLTAERKGLVLREKMNLIQAKIESDLLKFRTSMGREMAKKRKSLDIRSGVTERISAMQQHTAGSAYAFADPHREMDRQNKLSKEMDDTRRSERERQMVFRAKQDVKKLLSEKAVVSSLDKLGDQIDKLIAPLTMGATATTRAYNQQAISQQQLRWQTPGMPGMQNVGFYSASLGTGIGRRPVTGPPSAVMGGGYLGGGHTLAGTPLQLAQLNPVQTNQANMIRARMKDLRRDQQDEGAEKTALEAEQRRLIEHQQAIKDQVMRKFAKAKSRVRTKAQTLHQGKTGRPDADMEKWEEFTATHGAAGTKKFIDWSARQGGADWMGDDPWAKDGSTHGGKGGLTTHQWLTKMLKLDKAEGGDFSWKDRGIGVVLPKNYGTEQEEQGDLDIWSSMGLTDVELGMQLFQPQWATKADFPTLEKDKLEKINIEIAKELAQYIAELWHSLNQLKSAEEDLYDSQGVMRHSKDIAALKAGIKQKATALAAESASLAAIMAQAAATSGKSNINIIDEIENGIASLQATGNAGQIWKDIVDVDGLSQISKRLKVEIDKMEKDPTIGDDSKELASFQDALDTIDIALTEAMNKRLRDAQKESLNVRKAILQRDPYLMGIKKPLGDMALMQHKFIAGEAKGTVDVMRAQSFADIMRPTVMEDELRANQLLGPQERAQARIQALSGVRLKGKEDRLTEGQFMGINAMLQGLQQEEMAKQVTLNKTADQDEQKKLKEEIAKLRQAAKDILGQLERVSPRDEGFVSEFRQNMGAGLEAGFADVWAQSESLYIQLGQNIPGAFRDGLANAMQVALSGADDMEEKFAQIGISFLQMIQQAFLQSAASRIVSATGSMFGIGKASGGMVYGGSGTRDDVPAMLTGGEYVIKKSSVEKYGTGFLESLNRGELGGYARGGSVSLGIQAPSAQERKERIEEHKYGNVSRYDVVKKGVSIDSRLSGYARENDRMVLEFFKDRKQIFDEDLETQKQIKARAENARIAKKNKRNALRGALYGIAGGALISGAMNWVQEGGMFAGWDKKNIDKSLNKKGTASWNKGRSKNDYSLQEQSGINRNLTAMTNRGWSGSQISDYLRRHKVDHKIWQDSNGQVTWRLLNQGGAVSGRTPALLTGGEFVMSPDAARKYGPSTMSKINSGTFTGGGAASDTNISNDVNITVNVTNENVTSDVGGQGAGGIGDPNEFGQKVKAAVVQVIQEQQRVGGSLRR